MYGDEETVLDALRARGIASEVLESASQEAAETGRYLRYVLLDAGVVTEIELAEALADAYGLETVDLTQYTIDPVAAAKIPLQLARRHRVLGIKIENGELYRRHRRPGRRAGARRRARGDRHADPSGRGRPETS